MFILEEIEEAHSKVKSGADFPKYIQEIKTLGVNKFETWVKDSHIEYYGQNEYKASSDSMYENLEIENSSDPQNSNTIFLFINKEKQIILLFANIVRKLELKNGLLR